VFQDPTHAVVGVVKAPGSKYQHRMTLVVPTLLVDGNNTTLPDEGPVSPPSPGPNPDLESSFILEGPVALNVDGRNIQEGRLTRLETPTGAPSSSNDFFHVYKLGRFLPNAPRLPLDWPNRLTARLPITSGQLTVTEYGDDFLMVNADATVHILRRLTTEIDYLSDVPVASYLEFLTAKGHVRVKAAGALITLQIEALCACGEERIQGGDPLPGFEDVFRLYDNLPDAVRFVPHKVAEQAIGLPFSAAFIRAAFDRPHPVTPGPNCPPTEHDI
jgi:hypothetical protein